MSSDVLATRQADRHKMLASLVSVGPCLLCSLVLVLWQTSASVAFNVDIEKVSVITGHPGSLFGFTARFTRDREDDKLGLLVGAPKAFFEKTNIQSGALYQCKNVLNDKADCSRQIHYNDKLSLPNSTFDEMFGSSLVVSKEGQYMVCSPNWKDKTRKPWTFLLGRCTFSDLLKNDTNEALYPQFSQGNNNYIRIIEGKQQYFNGMANFGFSASGQEPVYVIGAPGVLMSEGNVFIIDAVTKEMSNINYEMTNKLNSTAYGYKGYSVKLGRFCDGADSCFAVSAPNQYRVGSVFIYKWLQRKDLKEEQKLEERQEWSYYGYSLCAVDSNDDGYDELLVGAPYWTDQNLGYDQGRVFIYSRSATQSAFEPKAILDGTKVNYARFGTAIQNIGDINLDKYRDIVVGAPGEDDGAGSIYIYLGGQAGLSNSPSQRIAAREINGLPTAYQGLGFAFSDHAVTADSQYPIFVASAIFNDTLAIFKTRPVVDVTTTLTATPNPANTEAACPVPAVIGSCFDIKLCLTYTIRGVKSKVPLAFKIGLLIDADVRSGFKRALIKLRNTSSVDSIPEERIQIAGNNITKCTNYTAVLRESQVNLDRFTPVKVVAKYTLDESSSALKPILDAEKTNNHTLMVTFANKCGDDNKCEVDLRVAGSLGFKHNWGSWDSIVVNDTRELQVTVIVANWKETSYWTVVTVEIDSPVSYIKSSSNVSINCEAVSASSSQSSQMNTTKVVCNLYKPLDQHGYFQLIVVFSTGEMALHKKTLTASVTAMPQNVINNPEVSSSDNSFQNSTDISIVADVLIYGSSTPLEVGVTEAKKIPLKTPSNRQIQFRPTGNKVQPINMTHNYLVTNNGPSFLPNTTLRISLPVYLLDGTLLVTAAQLTIETDDGVVSTCEGTKFQAANQLTPTSSPSPSNTSSASPGPTDLSKTTDSTGTTTWSPDGPINRRRRRDTGQDAQADTIYTLDCETDDAICEVFVCVTGASIRRRSQAKINVSLTVDSANIPLPENFKEFHYTVLLEVQEPTHPLFKSWGERQLRKTITKFYVTQPGGHINIWIIIGSVIAGLVLITIIVLVFWKLGFFKRKKHLEMEEMRRESMRKSQAENSSSPENNENGTDKLEGGAPFQ